MKCSDHRVSMTQSIPTYNTSLPPNTYWQNLQSHQASSLLLINLQQSLKFELADQSVAVVSTISIFYWWGSLLVVGRPHHTLTSLLWTGAYTIRSYFVPKKEQFSALDLLRASSTNLSLSLCSNSRCWKNHRLDF